MRLLFVLPEYLPDSGGGIITYYGELLPQLVEAGHSVHVLVASLPTLGRKSETISGVTISYCCPDKVRAASTGFDRFRTFSPTARAFLPIAWAAWEQASNDDYDLVETTDYALLFAPWVQEETRPYSICLHGSLGQISWFDSPGSRSLDHELIRSAETSYLGASRSLHTYSRNNQRFWEQSLRKEVALILPARTLEATKRNSSSERQPAGLVVGRLQNWKGPKVLCEALTSLKNVTLDWVGHSVVDPENGLPMDESLKRDYPKVIGESLNLVGPLPYDEVINRMKRAKFVCVPSTWDVFNLTAIEALSLGTPLICSESAGASTLIEHGVNGFTYADDSPEGLASCISAVMSQSPDEREAMVCNGLNTLRASLNPEQQAAQMVDFYRGLIEKQSMEPPRKEGWATNLLSPSDEGPNPLHLSQNLSIKELREILVLRLKRFLK